MIVSLILAIAAGIFAGAFTGITPGIHINLVSAALVSFSPALVQILNPYCLAVFVVAMAVTHTFIDAVPSIYLGAPDEETALAVLPGHRLLMKGIGHEAVRLTVIGSLLCLIVCAALFPLFVLIVPIAYSAVRQYIGWILAGIAVFMIFKEKNANKIFWSFMVFLFSGILGMIVLNLEWLRQPLFPLLSGLFGTSMLIHSIFNNVCLPPQKVTEMIKVGKAETAKAVSAGVLSGGITSMLPGVGASHAAIIASSFFKNASGITYLIIVGGVSTVNFVLSLATLYTLGKARNGAVAAVLQISGSISLFELALMIASALAAGGIAAVLALRISRVFCVFIGKIRYKLICICVAILISLLAFLFSGIPGIFILLVATAVGLIPTLTGVGKNNAMGCLLLPVILYFII